MKKYFKLIFVFLPLSSFAQGNLKSSLDKVKAYVKEIKSDKSTVNQSMSYDASKPYDVRLAIITTDSKGKSTEEVFEFNLALIGDIKRSASTKEMKVELNGQKNLKVIKSSKGGEMQNYEKGVVILAENVDDAREMEKKLKEAVTEAKTIWENSIKLPKDDLNALLAWLSGNIGEVSADKLNVKQSLKKSGSFKDRTIFTLEENDGKKTSDSQADFSWGDLNESSAELRINGKEVSVAVKSKYDYIRMDEGTAFKGYDDKLKFYARDPSHGSILLMAIQKVIPLAAKELKDRLPKVSVKEEGFKILREKLADFKINESTYSVGIEPSCQTTYIVKSEVKGKTVEEAYRFSFGDLNDFKMSVSKDMVKISSKVKDNKKFIRYTKDGQLQNYDNSIDFITGDIESGRYLAEALPAIVKGCKTADAPPADFAWIVKELKSIENPVQVLELQEGGDKCKLRFTSTQTDSKKTVEIIQELNLYDLDPKKTEIDVSGKTVSVSSYTVNKEKFIKQTKDGKPTFVNEIGFAVKDIETAKKAVTTFKSLIEGCKSK